MTTDVVLAIAGIALLVYGILGRKIKGLRVKQVNLPTEPLDLWQRFILVTFGLAFIAISILPILGIKLPTATATPVAVVAETSVLPTLTSTSAPSSFPTNTPTPSFTPIPECRFNNLLNCSTRVAFPEENFSAANLINGKLFLSFKNQQIGSGLAFQFKPPLNVQGFISLELVSTSTQGFTFLVEYKVKEGDQLKIVTTSERQSFPAVSIAIIFPIPITYDGEIDEIVINFFEIGESSELFIDSIRLK